MGLSNGSSQVRSPSKTRARYVPTGAVTASRTKEKMANFNQPLADISKILREQQGKSQVTQQQDGNYQSGGGHKVKVHGVTSASGRP
jgi:hypothetical protein